MKAMSLCAALALLAVAPAGAQTPQQPQSPQKAQSAQQAKATFMNAQGQQIGTATLTQTPNGVLIALDVTGLPAGEHAFHVHAVGRCEPNTGFESAGGHYDPRGNQHGFHVEAGPHAGDMPNQFVAQDGKLRAEVFNPNVTLGSGQATLFDQDGSALVIHAGADDYRSQPSGAAGGRIACAVINKT